MSLSLPPRVLALDLSLTRTGYAAPDGNAGVLRPPYDSKQPEQRITWLVDQVAHTDFLRVEDRIVNLTADVVAIEGFSFGSRGRALDQIHGLGWVVRMELHDQGRPFVLVPPSTLKRYATGKGNADKAAMLMAAVKRLGYDDPKPDDNVVDALWLRALALDAYGHPVVKIPQAQRDSAVKAVSWPRLRREAA